MLLREASSVTRSYHETPAHMMLNVLRNGLSLNHVCGLPVTTAIKVRNLIYLIQFSLPHSLSTIPQKKPKASVV